MSILQTHFNADINQCSPVTGDVTRIVKYGKDGEEIVTYEPKDFDSIIKSHGIIGDWSLNSLMKAGIDPDFPIRTGLSSRIEGVGIVNSLDSEIDKIIASDVDTIKESVE